jgi:hypothetical protein
MKRQPAAENGYTGTLIVLISLVILLSLVMYTAFISTGYASGRQAYAGMKRVTDNLVVSDTVTGYADQSGMLGQIRVDNPRPHPNDLGAVRVKIRLDSVRMMWQNDTGVDLSRATVTFTSPAGTETLPGTTLAILKKPCWKIVEKGSILPGHDADSDDLLEPNEVFILFIYPSAPLHAKTPFSLRIEFTDENPLTVSRVVPDPVIPVMDLK